jgi:beta-galactosidase
MTYRKAIIALGILLGMVFKGPEGHAQQPHQFRLADTVFLLDGKPFQIISGELHYERIPRPYWRSRLHMAKVMGLNTITTYCFWNVHEPRPGKFYFSGNADVAAFIRMAQQEGLWVILRPGPYVCAEWEFGGYPWWLLKEKDLRVRSGDPRFMSRAKSYLDALGLQLAPLQVTRGGPILMVQVENEYGSYGKDKSYETGIENLITHAGFDVPLFTADGDWAFKDAALPGVLPGANGETDIATLKRLVNQYHGGKGPYFIPEYYPGWLDHWGEAFEKVPADTVATQVSRLLSSGVSFNFYMFHGGTNFGFMNGANYTRQTPIQPDITSYDYDAPLSESGDATEKFRAIRQVIGESLPAGTRLPDMPAEPVHIQVPYFRMRQGAGLFENLPAPVTNEWPLNMEALDQGYGYVLYRTQLPPHSSSQLKIGGLRDYALVFIDGKRIGVLNRMKDEDSLELPAQGSSRLDILVENLGRINYGAGLPDNHKGITGTVEMGGHPLKGWKMYRFPLTHPETFRFSPGYRGPADLPVIRKGSFYLGKPGDTFLDMRGWGKGAAWINGHPLGRYWNIGPQQTLYLPGCWLVHGVNTLLVFEELDGARDSIRTQAAPVLDQLRP